MEIRDSVNGREPAGPSAGTPARGTALDRLELKHEWVQQEDEQQVEETLNLYAQAARQRMQTAAPPAVPEPEETEEEREARSQQLKLQQKCQDIAALIMVDELEEELEDEPSK